jgi:hypothetical protein
MSFEEEELQEVGRQKIDDIMLRNPKEGGRGSTRAVDRSNGLRTVLCTQKMLAELARKDFSDDIVQFGPKSVTNNKRSIHSKNFPKQNRDESKSAVLFRGHAYGGVHLFSLAIHQELRELY